MRWASRAVTRPWSTASLSTSSMRSREIITISIGLIRFLRTATRSSATVLASTPAPRAPRAAVPAVAPAALRAFCWRARALPPLLAAALRDAELRDDEDLAADVLRVPPELDALVFRLVREPD